MSFNYGYRKWGFSNNKMLLIKGEAENLLLASSFFGVIF
jgi:hypothetical protein